MTTAVLITAIVVFVVAGNLFYLGLRSLAEKGFLFNNAYIYATEEERKTMDKKPYYRQTGIVFLLLGGAFLVIGLSLATGFGKLRLLEIPLLAGAAAYAVASTVRINKNKKA